MTIKFFIQLIQNICIQLLICTISTVTLWANESTNFSSNYERKIIEIEELQNFLDNFFERQINQLRIPGAVFIMVKDDEILISKG